MPNRQASPEILSRASALRNPKSPLNSLCELTDPGLSFWVSEQERGKNLKIELLPCELTIYFSHKCW